MSTSSRKTGLLRLSALQEQTELVQEQMDVERIRFERLADPTSTPRSVSAFNLFPTPEHLADRMAGLLAPIDSERILEPSAGLGSLFQSVRKLSDCEMVLVEVNSDCARELYGQTETGSNCTLVQDDFLECGSDRLGQFDAVIMNPPFKQGRDCKHVLHAISLLNPSGRLVGLCYHGKRQNAKLKPLMNRWEVLPSGTFSGTRAESVLFTYRK